jgi:signal transduction histidine kinase
MTGARWRHPVLTFLARDGFVRAFGVVFALELVGYLIPVGTRAFREEFGRVWFQLPFAALVAPAAMIGLHRIADHEERRFWRAIAASGAVWCAASFAYAIVPPAESFTWGRLVLDALYLGGYLPLLAAVEWRPHRGVPPVRWDPDRWTHLISASCVAVGWFAYFVALPAWLDTQFYGSSVPTYLMFIALDLTLVALYFFVGRRCQVPRWRVLYWAVGAGCLVVGLADTLDLLVEAGLLGWTNGEPTDLFWTAPAFALVVAIRIRHAPLASTAPVEPGSSGFALAERTRSGAMVLGSALSFPLIHLWLQPLLPPTSADLRRAQGMVVLAMLGLLGALAVVTYRLLGIRHRALAEMHQNVLQRLHEAQRLEAVGRLAGGVAHDFNNILTGIVGYNDMALHSLPDGDPNRPALEQIAAAASRASDLTQQLLALSRRQILKPEILNLNAVVGRLEAVLARVIGEDIRLITSLDPDAHDVVADPSQVQTIILTLAANARDAMPTGGTVEIGTANVGPGHDKWSDDSRRAAGEFVALSVRDTGPEIPLASQVHIFEPFFSEGVKGRGSGLSLAAVYGIVTQSGGTIDVRSEPGAGATFVVRLPRAHAATPAKEYHA